MGDLRAWVGSLYLSTNPLDMYECDAPVSKRTIAVKDLTKNLPMTASGCLITHKYRGSQHFSISKSVEPNEELKVEQIFPQVLSTTDATLRTLDVRFT